MKKEENKKVINILWTGGWDSTYRVLCLSRLDVTIQPHYIYYKNRRSRENELNAMNEIAKLIKKDKRTKAKLNDTIIVDHDDIKEDETISQSFNRIKDGILIGAQYDYLARYAKTLGHMELGWESGGLSEDMINKYGKMKKGIDENGFETYILDEKVCSKDLLNVFGYFRFPIYDLSKLDEKAKAIEYDFIDIMYHTWFCHFPKNGKACGSCMPCQETVEYGLEERLSKEAMKRYHFEKKHQGKLWYKLYKKIRRRIFKY